MAVENADPTESQQTWLGLGEPGPEDGQGREEIDAVQVIGLQVASEYFAINILDVDEIVPFKELEITRVPHGHFYVLGVVNLRGKVVSVIDLSTRLGLRSDLERLNRMIVVEVDGQRIGFTVDAVSDVLSLPKDAIEPPTTAEEYITGVATVDGQIMTILNLEKTLVSPAAEERTS
jgi:purine-binding chemotaxis protein CheW